MKTITINKNTYNCVLKIKTCVQLEKKLGTNPLNVLFAMQNGLLPDMEAISTIFHYCLIDMNHGIDEDTAYELLGQFMQENNKGEEGGLGAVINFIAEVFQDSGFLKLPEEGKKGKKTKNG